jgi:hypothetical protein
MINKNIFKILCSFAVLVLLGTTAQAQFKGGSGKGDTTITILNASFTDGTPVVQGGSGRGDFMAGVYLNALPLTLTNFKGYASNYDGELTWTTQSEKNVARFEVERSFNRKNFAPLAEVAAKGNTSGASNYSYSDKNVGETQKTVYYRLRMVDNDGSFKYSNVIAINFITKKLAVKGIMPNPVSSESFSANIVAVEAATTATIQILNMDGNAVYSEQVKLQKGNNTWNSNGLKLSAGAYFLEVRQGGNVDRMKFIKY